MNLERSKWQTPSTSGIVQVALLGTDSNKSISDRSEGRPDTVQFRNFNLPVMDAAHYFQTSVTTDNISRRRNWKERGSNFSVSVCDVTQPTHRTRPQVRRYGCPDLHIFPHACYVARQSNPLTQEFWAFSQPRATFNLLYRLAGLSVIDEDNVLVRDGKSPLVLLAQCVALVLLINFPYQNQ